jgi:hypothetical protein
MEATAGGGQQWAWALEANRSIPRREGMTSRQGGRCQGAELCPAWDVELDLFSGLPAPPAEGGWEGNGPSVAPSASIKTQTPSSREAPGLAMAKGLSHLPVCTPGFP